MKANKESINVQQKGYCYAQDVMTLSVFTSYSQIWHGRRVSFSLVFRIKTVYFAIKSDINSLKKLLNDTLYYCSR